MSIFSKIESVNSAIKVIPVEEKIFIFVGSNASSKTHLAGRITNAVVHNVIYDPNLTNTYSNRQTFRKQRKDIQDIICEFKLGEVSVLPGKKRILIYPEDSILILVTDDFEHLVELHQYVREILSDIKDGFIV